MFRSELARKNIESVDIQGMKVLGEFKTPPANPEPKPEAQGPPPPLKKQFETTLPPMALSDSALDGPAAGATRRKIQGLGARR